MTATQAPEAPKRIQIDMDELEALRARAKSGPLSEDDDEKLKALFETLFYMQQELEGKGASIKRLRNLLFGPSSEKTSKVLNKDSESKDKAQAESESGEKKKKKRKGHGRNGASAYSGAEKVEVAHESLKSGEPCPEPPCEGKVYKQKTPGVIVRVRGQAPVAATVYELEKLRCNLCGKIFTAKAPEEVGEKKHDESAAAIIATLKYGSGLPFNRLEKLQAGFGIPLPASTQWEIVNDAAGQLPMLLEEFVRQAAQGEVVHNDDTSVKILELLKENARRRALEEKPPDKERSGIFTSGIVSKVGDHKIVLFFSGRKHAGENLEAVLKRRAEELGPPIHMCDALAVNTAGDFKTILANCLLHARRNFVDVIENFPQECRFVLEKLKDVYKNEAETKKNKLSAEDRLLFHQEKSAPLMKDLEDWFEKQFEEKLVEKNSSLGEAITYMTKRWDKWTLFLRKAGAPLDNNLVERALKKAILHRKNSLFYKTAHGAEVGDFFMSLIYTAELAGVDPFDYLRTLLLRVSAVASNPAEWMPWNYRDTLASLSSPPDS